MGHTEGRLADLTAEQKRELLERLLQQRAGQGESSYPLSHGQRALWYIYRIAPESAAYNIACAARICSPVDVPALRRAFEAAVDRHAVLRSVYSTEDGLPIQRVHKPGDISFEVTTCASWSWAEMQRRMLEEADRPFDLERGPVLRVNLFLRSAHDALLEVTVHHIAADLWSLELLFTEVSELYRNEKSGLKPALSPLRLRYSDYVRWQAEMLEGPEGEELFAYWKRGLAGELSALHLPTDRPRPPFKTYCGEQYGFRVARETFRQLVALARTAGATPYMVLLAAFQVLLHRYSGQEDILVGSPTAGRSRPEHEGIVGYFSNPVVLRAEFAGNPTFRDFLAQVRARVLGALAHQDYPFSLLVERLQSPRDPSRSPLFDVAFAWDKLRRPERCATAPSALMSGQAETCGGGGLELELIFSQQRGAPFDLTLSIVEGREGLSGAFQYNTNLFDASTIARMARHFANLLEAVASDADRGVRSLRLLSRDEKGQIVVAWNESAAEYPRNATASALFEAQVGRTPGAVAVREDEKELTYAELNRRANQLGHHLRSLQVRPEVRVGMCLRRSLDTVVAILAILKAGGAYVPVDPRWPRERAALILKDAGVSVLLTETEVAGPLAECGAGAIVCLDAERERISERSPENLDGGAGPENLAYVIYTSGSTGTPKGVMIPHRGLVNYSCWSARAYSVEAGRGVPVHTSIGFDLTITSLFPPLLAGQLVVLLTEGREIEALSGALSRSSDFSLVKLTPAHLQLLARRCCARDVGGGTRALVIGGEALSADALSFWRTHAPATRLINEYGPTETVVGCCVYEVVPGVPPSGGVPIGRPVANARAYVLDEELEPVPIGVVGELYIGGDGLARGYLGHPDVTAESFIPDPFSEAPGARLYRTRDLGRYLETGVIEFVGRADRQVKIRGFRIEPGEIEILLNRHPAVRESVVVAREDEPGERRLVGYWAPAGNGGATAAELRSFLKERLPDYMLPSAFVELDRLPVTSNGKIDRRSLPLPDGLQPVPGRGLAAPRTPQERTLAEIWAQVLGIEKVGIHDNFFELGGTSLHSVEIAARAQDAGMPLEPEFLLKYQTIAELVTAFGKISHAQAMTSTIIESLGVYLPPKTVSTGEVVRGCRRSLTLPLERITGIASRHVAGEREFSKDLAEHAVYECLAVSTHGPEDIDILICCNISRYDGPDFRVSFEPCTSVKLRHTFDFNRAVVLDISNACAGMFTALYVVDALIKAGVARRAVVVSGEYISHLTETAQHEIQGDLDARLACLTLGDAGAAVILEESPSDTVGLHEIDLYTLGRYSSYCIAKATDGEKGGAIMLTDAIRSTALAVKHAVKHAAHVLGRRGWSPDDVQHVIMHQTSRLALRSAVQEINRLFGRPVCHDGNVINNLARRGNTATTTHIVALRDAILDGRIARGDRIVFGISGSGQTIGTALYTLDDLPDRIRQRELNKDRVLTWVPGGSHAAKAASVRQIAPGVERRNADMLDRTSRSDERERAEMARNWCLQQGTHEHSRQRAWGRHNPRRRGQTVRRPAARVESIGTVAAGVAVRRDAIEMARVAAGACFTQSTYRPSDIDVIVYTGVYRNDFLCEPAIAAILAGDLRMNDDIESPDGGRKTLAFDVFNGAVGFLKACYVGAHLIEAARASTVMVVASEVENNRDANPDMLLGIEETGSAMILHGSGDTQAGFGRFVFRYRTRFIDAFASYTGRRDGKICLSVDRDPEWETYLLECIPDAVTDLLDLEKVALSEIKAIFPPQISSRFAGRLAGALGVAADKVVDVAGDGRALAGSSLPYGWLRAREQDVVTAGDLGLLISAGSGVEVGCVLYRF